MFLDGSVEEKVSFRTVPKPKGRLEWKYSVVEVKGKYDTKEPH
jgi:hypothetical protein